MTIPLEILIVEDSEDDARLLASELENSGFAVKWKRIETESDYRANLGDHLDVVFSDFTLPHFSMARAMELLRESGLDVPFIIVSATFGEERLAESLKAGASDYVPKNRLTRLGLVVQRALRERLERAERRRAEQEIRVQACALEAAANAILITDLQGNILSANAAFCALTGYSKEEVIGKNPRMLKSGEHAAELYRDLWSTINSGRVWRGEMINRRKDGSLYNEEMTVTPVRAAGGNVSHFIAVKQDITESKRTAEALNLFRALIERSSDGIEVVDPATGRFLDINEAMCRGLGYTRQELLSMRVQDIQMDAMDSAAWNRTLEQICQTGFKIITGRHRRKDGSIFPVEVNANYVRLNRDYLIAVVRDVTDRKQAEETLRESERRFRELLENVQLIAMILDKNGTITFCNDYLLHLTGWTRDEAIGSNWFDQFIPETATGVKEMFFETIASGAVPAHYDNPIRTRAGHLHEIRWNNTVLRGPMGDVIGIASIGEDVTDRLGLESQLRHVQKMESVGQLAGGIAHDFNNMLVVIQGHAQLMLNAPDCTDENAESSREILAAAERAANLTRQLLTFGRKQVAQFQALDLNEVVRNMTKMFRHTLRENISRRVDLGANLPLIQADIGMMEQVLMNLAVNARDAMPRGGELVISTSQAVFDAEYAQQNPEARPGRFACLSVADSGAGIPREILPRIFEPFFTTKGVGQGTGLGLATVYAVVQQHGGWITVESDIGKGTTFRIFLPAIEARKQPGL